MTHNHRFVGLWIQLDALLAMGVAVLLVHHGRTGPLFFSRVDVLDALVWMTLMILWTWCFRLLRMYDRFTTVVFQIRSVFKGLCILAVPSVAYLKWRHSDWVNMWQVTKVFLVLCVLGSLRVLMHVLLVHFSTSRDPRRVVIVGSGRRASKAWREVRTRYHNSVVFLGFLDDRLPEEMPPDVAKRYRGPVAGLSDLLLREIVDLVIIAMPVQSCYPLMQHAVQVAESVGVEAITLGDLYASRTSVSAQGEQSVFIELSPHRRQHVLRLMVKRCLDVIVSALSLIALAPLFVLLALGVKLTSKGPIFFVQQRYGFRRRVFRMIKFRSMVPDAEQQLHTLEHANEAQGPIFKIRNDPRVTPFGRFLRRTSMDELPQLWNVLRGHMSLVGPRPMSLRDVSLFDHATLLHRFSVKPGMTGLWQVNGRSDVTFDHWIALDRSYIDRWSLLLDLRILWRTVGVVFRRSGAM